MQVSKIRCLPRLAQQIQQHSLYRGQTDLQMITNFLCLVPILTTIPNKSTQVFL